MPMDMQEQFESTLVKIKVVGVGGGGNNANMPTTPVARVVINHFLFIQKLLETRLVISPENRRRPILMPI